ncbi:hypothetical protein [Robertmurraya siralis]|uniref:hypothetical protein n=1 Tax=Robertmurraya siralis TaxID=77777 RepID=UPI0010F6CA21|nr:hypothetical protein [Robertmurraya siralis]
MLAREYIEKALYSCQRALKDLKNDDIRKTLGDLDFVEDRVKAAKILLRLELKEREGSMKNG